MTGAVYCIAKVAANFLLLFVYTAAGRPGLEPEVAMATTIAAAVAVVVVVVVVVVVMVLVLSGGRWLLARFGWLQ